MDESERRVERAIGGLEAHRDMTDDRLRSIEEKLDTLVEQMARAHGGIKTLISVGTISASLGAMISSGISWVISHAK